MALIVVEMGRRVVTPQKTERRGTVKTQASKSTPVIDQYQQFHSDEVQTYNDQGTYLNSEQNNKPRSKHRQAQRKPSRVSLLSEIMSQNVITLKDSATVADAWLLFQHHGFHHIPIIDEKNITLAMLSDRDIMQGPSAQKNINQENIMKFASHQVFCFSPDTDIRQATRALYEYDLGALPIISNDHELLGIVSRTDIMKVVSHYGPLELWA